MSKSYTLVVIDDVPHALFEGRDKAREKADKLRQRQNVNREDVMIWYPVSVAEAEEEE